MKKADFDLAKAAASVSDQTIYKEALQAVKAYEPVLNSRPREITAHWVGMKEGVPYVMVAVESGSTERPDKLLPDKLGHYPVYYIEGKGHLAATR